MLFERDAYDNIFRGEPLSLPSSFLTAAQYRKNTQKQIRVIWAISYYFQPSKTKFLLPWNRRTQDQRRSREHKTRG